MSNGGGGSRHAPQPEEASPAQRGEPPHELPETVRTLIEARTGDAVYVVGPDYTIVHWDRKMESLSGVLSEEALGGPCYEAVMGEEEGSRPFCANGCSVMHLAQEGRPGDPRHLGDGPRALIRLSSQNDAPRQRGRSSPRSRRGSMRCWVL